MANKPNCRHWYGNIGDQASRNSVNFFFDQISSVKKKMDSNQLKYKPDPIAENTQLLREFVAYFTFYMLEGGTKNQILQDDTFVSMVQKIKQRRIRKSFFDQFFATCELQRYIEILQSTESSNKHTYDIDEISTFPGIKGCSNNFIQSSYEEKYSSFGTCEGNGEKSHEINNMDLKEIKDLIAYQFA